MKPIILALVILPLINVPVVYKAEPQPLLEPVVLTNYDIELTQWVEKLAKCESSNNPKAVNQFDGGSASLGYVQYKKTTWAMYNKKFNLPYTEEQIWDKEAQIAVTKEIITNEPNGYKNWYNCTNAIGLPPKQ
jgi:hypothetical protein